MFLFNKKKELVGIDIGSTSVKLVQLKDLNGAWQLVAMGIAPLPPEAVVDNTILDRTAVVQTLQRLTGSLGIKAKDVCCSISGNSVIIRKISLPAMPSDELEDQIQWEAEQYIPFEIRDVNLDFQILAPDAYDPSKMHVLLVASKKEIINDYVSLFGEAGMQLSVIDVDSFAVQNSFEINNELNPGEVVALINIGASIMSINIVKDNVTLFTRDVQMGGNLYTEEIQRQLGITGDEAESAKKLAADLGHDSLLQVIGRMNENVALEIRRSLDYFNSTATDDRISRILFSGGGSMVHGLRESAGEKLGLPVGELNPFARLLISDKEFDPEYLKEMAPFMAVTVGLAIRRAGDK